MPFSKTLINAILNANLYLSDPFVEFAKEKKNVCACNKNNKLITYTNVHLQIQK